jgi:hypothetical protein
MWVDFFCKEKAKGLELGASDFIRLISKNSDGIFTVAVDTFK